MGFVIRHLCVTVPTKPKPITAIFVHVLSRIRRPVPDLYRTLRGTTANTKAGRSVKRHSELLYCRGSVTGKEQFSDAAEFRLGNFRGAYGFPFFPNSPLPKGNKKRGREKKEDTRLPVPKSYWVDGSVYIRTGRPKQKLRWNREEKLLRCKYGVGRNGGLRREQFLFL